jgi:hypothetical protein
MEEEVGTGLGARQVLLEEVRIGREAGGSMMRPIQERLPQ